MGAAGAGAGIGMAGAAAGGIADIKEAQYQAKILKDNAKVAQQIAEQALWRGEQEAWRRSEEVRQLEGKQRTGITDAGFDPNFGSSLDILADTAAAGAADAVVIRYNAELEAWNAENEAVAFQNQARLGTWAAPIRAHAGVAQAAGGAVGSAGRGRSAGGAQTPQARTTTLGSYEPPYTSQSWGSNYYP